MHRESFMAGRITARVRHDKKRPVGVDDSDDGTLLLSAAKSLHAWH